jgi:outer membrane protein OmpA-like peptidoglycan-associated protein
MNRSVVLTLGLSFVGAALSGCHSGAPGSVAPAVQPASSAHAASSAHTASAPQSAATDSARRSRIRTDSIARATATATVRAAARKEAVADSTRVVEEEKKNLAVRARAEMLEAIMFAPKVAELRVPEQRMLDHKAALLKANESVHLRIDGNTDEKEATSDQERLALGTQRAQAAQRYLTEHGIDASRIEITSSGVAHPVCQDHMEWCWSQNRRDVFTIVSGGDTIVPGG